MVKRLFAIAVDESIEMLSKVSNPRRNSKFNSLKSQLRSWRKAVKDLVDSNALFAIFKDDELLLVMRQSMVS